MQRLDDLERQLAAAVENRIGRARHAAALLDTRFRHLHPQRAIDVRAPGRESTAASLLRDVRGRIETARSRTASLGRALNAVSPLATLGRGFAIVTTPAPSSQRWGTPITSIGDTRSGAKVVAHLQDGVLHCTVDGIESNANLSG